MKNEPSLLSFVSAIAALREKHRTDRGYSYVTNFGATIREGGTKFLRVMSTETYPNGETRESIYCFIAMVDSVSNALGTVKKGDVLKPASWKAPAKHARGNIFNADNGLSSCDSYGPRYLK